MSKYFRIAGLLILLLFLGCGGDRATVSENPDNAVKGATDTDTDGDGLLDSYEILIGTQIDSVDSDDDNLSDKYEDDNGLNPTNPDTDGDTLNDYYELFISFTNPKNMDSDGDGLTDGMEVANGSDPNDSNDPKNLVPDSDNDGLSDIYENILGSLPNNSDSDGDGLSDGDEVNTYHTDPIKSDSDGDGLNDKYEISNGLNPNSVDSDGDGLSDGDEVNTYDTDPTKSDSDGDGLDDKYEITNGLEPTNADSDGDGLSDGDEVNTYHTDPKKSDSDGDGLDDKYEISNGLDANSSDSDGDGLNDGDEMNTYHTNPNSIDSDGDCLLDTYEINNYDTNATNVDSDGDGVEDGIEIYSTGADNLNVSCLTSPETSSIAANSTPAKDNLPLSRTVDLINALDPLNDSDGDGQVNIQELNCSEGNPKDQTKMCAWSIEDENGTTLTNYGFAYLPGGFDVDGDGIEEGGFWVSAHAARSTGVDIEKDVMINTIGKYNTFIQNHFKMVNATDTISPIITGYVDTLLDEDHVRRGAMLDFSDEVDAGTERLSTLMPFVAMASLEKFKLTNSEGEEIDISVSMPNLKQYSHIKKLLDADKANGGDGKHIRNGLLGIDKNAPLVGYIKVIEEFGTGYKEYLSSMMQMKNSAGEIVCTGCPWVESWMEIDTDNVVKNANGAGANSTIDLGMGAGSSKDNYGVLVRAGTLLDLTQGPAGIDSDTLIDENGYPNGISFRGATPYLY
ncbi:hypothetical protein KKC13_01060 [bacterium]|nr:hypothetical protein [bacterium]MBU1957768.1 hypothetical protein [bacterium]